jgi:hypothetical protein
MRFSVVSLCGVFILLSQLNGCDSKDDFDDFFKDPDPAAIESSLKTAIPVGYASSLAMNAMAGDLATNVSIVNKLCTSDSSTYPCSAWIAITYDPDTYPMPVETGSSGEIIVVGLWTSIDTAILSVFFTDLDIYTGSFRLYDVDIFPVVRTGNVVTAVYADIDVNVGSTPVFPLTLTSTEIDFQKDRFTNTSPPNPPLPPDDSQVSVEEEAWIVKVDCNSTTMDFNDDTYTINGAGQFVGASTSSASIQQVVFLGVQMSSACTLNPTEGLSIINDIAVSTDTSTYVETLGSALFTFHRECNGEADVTAAVGSYVGSFGDSLTLNLSP